MLARAVQLLLPDKSARSSLAVSYLFCVVVAAGSHFLCKHLAPGIETPLTKSLLIGAIGPFGVAIW